MEVALDTVVVQHLVRTPNPDIKETVLDEPMAAGRLSVHVDPDRALVDEWMDTIGPDIVRQLVVRWVDLNGMFEVESLGRLKHQTSRRLRQLGFTDTIDKVVLRIALAIEDRVAVSTDSDFWDPSIPGQECPIGDPKAPIAKLCYDEEGISIRSLQQLIAAIE